MYSVPSSIEVHELKFDCLSQYFVGCPEEQCES